MLNILEFIFLSLALVVTFTGVLISKYENHLPVFVIKGYKYGSFAYQGSGGNFLQLIELPKAYYRHFYLFSSTLSVITLGYMFMVYSLDYDVNRYAQFTLKLLLEQYEPSGKIYINFFNIFIQKFIP